MGFRAVHWIVSEAFMAEVRGGMGRNGTILVIPGADTSLSGWRFFLGGLRGAILVISGAYTGPSG